MVLSGCSNPRIGPVNTDGQTVDMDVSSDATENVNSEIVIENNQYGPVGPTGQASEVVSSIKKNSVIAAIMPIGHFSLYAYVGLLKGLEHADIKIRIFNGTAIASYFAAFVANEGTSSLLEWNILKEFGDEVNFEYRAKDVERFDQVFSIDKDKKIEDLTHLLFISIYNQKNQIIEFYNKGKLGPTLNKAFQNGSEGNLLFPAHVLKKRGADKVIAFVFDEQDMFKKMGGKDLIGQYNKMMSRVWAERKKLDYLCKLKVGASTEKQVIVKQVYEQVVKCALEINQLVAL